MIYQIFMGRWQSASLLYHPGSVFSRMQSHDWKGIRQAGFSQVYLLGLFEHQGQVKVDFEEGVSLKAADHRLTSVFAITDHRAIDPQLGNKADLLALIKTIHRAGLQVVVDFVPNHRSSDHIWTQTHPDYFRYQHGRLIAEFSGDVVKLDYENPKLVQQMLATLEYIADLGVDGVRCDMAHYVPDKFWREAIAEIRKHYQEFIFWGEVYPDSAFELSIYQDFVNLGFNGVYHGVLFDNLNRVIAGDLPVEALASHLQYVSTQNYAANLIHYASNHDDFLDDYQIYAEAAWALCCSLPGSALSFNGSLRGQTKRLQHHRYDQVATIDLETIVTVEWQKLGQIFARAKQGGLRFYQEKGLLYGKDTKATSVCVYNFGKEARTIDCAMTSEGAIHRYKNKSLLAPGEAELFISL